MVNVAVDGLWVSVRLGSYRENRTQQIIGTVRVKAGKVRELERRGESDGGDEL